MSSLDDLTKEQKCAAYVFLEEYAQSIPSRRSARISPYIYFTSFRVGIDEIKNYRKHIEDDDKFSYAIGILKDIDNQRFFMRLLDYSYNILQYLVPIEENRYFDEYSKLRDFFKKEFGYDHIPISECLP